MNRGLVPGAFFAGLFACAGMLAVLSPRPVGYMGIALAFLFVGVWFFSRNLPDRAMYVIAAALPLTISFSLVSVWAGLFTVWMAGGIVAEILGMLSSRNDAFWLLLFCVCTFVIAVFVWLSNHAGFLLLFAGAVFLSVTVVVFLRSYRFKKQYAGALP